MKKLILCFLLIIEIFAADISTLSGDEKLSCEAILCLSTSSRPSECNESIRKYFSISFKRWSDTVSARRAFLNICPVGTTGNNDKTFVALRDDVISNLNVPCTLESLNREEERYPSNDEGGIYYLNQQFRINPEPTTSCNLLMGNSYTDIKAEYTCNQNIWYSYNDWKNGYTLTVVSRDEWLKLNQSEKAYYDDEYSMFYYKKTPINKNCWKFKE